MISRSAACAALVGATSALAQPRLYFSEYAFQDARFAAINLDGSNAQQLFPLQSNLWLPMGATFDPGLQRMIWIDSIGNAGIYSANLDGSQQVQIAAIPGFCRGATRDAQGRIYFTSGNTVQRVNADGSGRVVLHTSTNGQPPGNPRVDAVNGFLYVGCDESIKRMNLDGSDVKAIVRGISQCRAIGLDVAHGEIFWLDADTISDYVGRAKLDGSDFTVLVDVTPSVVQSPGLTDLLVDPVSGLLFYGDEFTQNIRSATLDGQNHQVVYTSSGSRAPLAFTLSTGEPAQALQDCNANGIADQVDIASGEPDCDNNGVPDSCQSNPCPQRVLLLDQSSDAANSQGHTVGFVSEWQLFQPFDVPAGGWEIGELALDGFNVNFADGTGMTVTVFPDDGTGQRADESEPIASTVIQVRFGTSQVTWVYAPLSAALPQGRHWVRIEANDPGVYHGVINYGFTGLASIARGASGNFTVPLPPAALRLIEAVECAADFDHDGFVTGIDYDLYVAAFEAGDMAADFDRDGFITGIDFDLYVAAFEQGC